MLGPFEQYLLYGMLALAATLIVLWAYNRREARRKHALELASLMNQWGMAWFADAYECYAVGDYSGLTHKVREVVSAVRTDEVMVSKLWDATTKVATYVSANDATKAAQLRKILAETTIDVTSTPVSTTTATK